MVILVETASQIPVMPRDPAIVSAVIEAGRYIPP
jgi:hypothetical protein